LFTSSSKPLSSPPNLYLVAVGVSHYKGESLRLRFASKDADDLSDALSAAAGKLLNTDGRQHVKTYRFDTESGASGWPSKSNIHAAFDSIAKKATADDIVIVFFAGHGMLRGGERNFYLVTAEAASLEQAQSLPGEVAISTEELNAWLQKIKANKQLLILDACNSGQGLNDLEQLMAKREVPADQRRALENLKDRSGTYILSASAANQSAYETGLYNQGLLTYSLLSGIKLGTGLRDNRFIDVTDWFNDAARNAETLARDIGGKQQPQIIGRASFDVGLVDHDITVGIRLSIRKAVFGRSKFIEDEELLNDDLNLSGLIDQGLKDLSAAGKESPLLFVADNSLSEAYSIRGKYVVKGQIITTRVSLIQGQSKRITQFDLTGTINNKEELVSSILAQAEHAIQL
jgi:hypothetical protein